ncbi:MAG: hypothetical protein M3P39_08360 [Actinomycetota bacterium]|nr:hypothetical protein [Actinomycetota bacterium]
MTPRGGDLRGQDQRDRSENGPQREPFSDPEAVAPVERELGLSTSARCSSCAFGGLERVRLHADLTILAKLAGALSRAPTVPLAAGAA